MDNPSPLLRLPSEIRLRIYEFVLAPTGVLCLSSNRSRRSCGSPLITSALLATCRQIYRETKPVLYAENEVCLYVDAHDICWPIDTEARLSQCALRNLQHLCLILDCTGFFGANYHTDVDFTPFSALVSLKSVRITLAYRILLRWADVQPAYGPEENLLRLLTEILSRVPATTVVVYGTEPGSPQHAMLMHLLSIRLRNPWGMQQDLFIKHDLAQVAAQLPDNLQGSLSGRTSDVPAEQSSASQSCSVSHRPSTAVEV